MALREVAQNLGVSILKSKKDMLSTDDTFVRNTISGLTLDGLIPSCFWLQRSGRAAENQRPLAPQQNLYFSPLLQGHGA